MLKNLYDKSPIRFAIGWIIAYCVLFSVGDALSAMVGLEKSVTLAVGLLLMAVLFLFLKKNRLMKDYGLCPSQVPARVVLWYLPLLLLLTANLWFGVKLNYGAIETVLYILSMFCVGFLEEVIFRGLLFEAMRKESPKAAVIVSSITFGIGHIINLFNGSGAELLPNLLQVVYATAAGFMFVMLYCKTKSLLACIITHSIFNALSVFAVDAPTLPLKILTCGLLTLISAGYALYLKKKISQPAG